MSGARTERRLSTDPRRLVTQVPQRLLVEAMYNGLHPFGILDRDELGVWFICPTCGHIDHNGGSAELLDPWRWRCHRCRRTRTRYLLERLVVEDAEFLERLYTLLAEADQ